MPVKPEDFEVADWDSSHHWTLNCRHLVFEGEKKEEQAATIRQAFEDDSTPMKRRIWHVAKRGFRQIHPWLSPKTVERITRAKQLLFRIAAKGRRSGSSKASFGRMVFEGLRGGYRRHIRRRLSPEAIAEITKAKEAVLTLLGRPPSVVNDPLLPTNSLTLSGLVYTSIFNLSDRRKNHLDMLSAFLLAFRDRADVTLVIKAASNPAREFRELAIFRAEYESLGILDHKCRLIVITEFLDDAQMRELLRATTYYVNTSRAEGACLPLQQALASGRPGIAPKHSSMADYMDDRVGFILSFSDEPTFWPHDPARLMATTWGRLAWADLYEKFLESARIVENEPARYRALSIAARARIAEVASRERATAAFRAALASLPEKPIGAFAWAS